MSAACLPSRKASWRSQCSPPPWLPCTPASTLRRPEGLYDHSCRGHVRDLSSLAAAGEQAAVPRPSPATLSMLRCAVLHAHGRWNRKRPSRRRPKPKTCTCLTRVWPRCYHRATRGSSTDTADHLIPPAGASDVCGFHEAVFGLRDGRPGGRSALCSNPSLAMLFGTGPRGQFSVLVVPRMLRRRPSHWPPGLSCWARTSKSLARSHPRADLVSTDRFGLANLGSFPFPLTADAKIKCARGNHVFFDSGAWRMLPGDAPICRDRPELTKWSKTVVGTAQWILQNVFGNLWPDRRASDHRLRPF